MRKKEERHIRELEFRENVRVFNVYFNFETIESFTLSLSLTHTWCYSTSFDLVMMKFQWIYSVKIKLV